ncbi:MAG: DUF2971 domain-containing protein [Eubacteriales bacterium]
MIHNDFLNARLNGQDVSLPKELYKYRPFDEYTLDMLENEYLFLCKAENLDDPSECTTSLTPEAYYDVKTNRLSYRVVDGILEYLRPYCLGSNFEDIRNQVYRTMAPDGYVKRDYLLDASFEMQKLAPSVDIAPFINFLGNIPEIMQEPEMGKNIEKLFSLAFYARQDMGICSLSELLNSHEMWENYADHSTGYCIEYSTDDYDHSGDIFPVVYSDERNTDILSAILGGLLGKFIFETTNGQIDADKSQYFQLFLTKNRKWKYQKEWRIIGQANEKLKSPKIQSIILGQNVSDTNRHKMQEYCNWHDISIIEQKQRRFRYGF